MQPDRVVIQVLDDLPATPEVIEVLRACANAGTRSRVGDFSSRQSDRALLEVADIVKVALSREQDEDLARTVKESQVPAASR